MSDIRMIACNYTGNDALLSRHYKARIIHCKRLHLSYHITNPGRENPTRAISLMTTFLDYKWQLRFAQAQDTLNDLRQHLRLLTQLFTLKDQFVRGQCDNTWA